MRGPFLLCIALCATALPANAAVRPFERRMAPLGAARLTTFTSSSNQITNPYLPMPPNVTFIYDGSKGNKAEHDVIVDRARPKVIVGIPCQVQLDTVYLNGIIIERTLDYFAQDAFGNVWYFGEYATQYKNGQPKGHSGSWQTGVNGAQPGIVMETTPHVGDRYNQENAPGVAEDKAQVRSLTASVYTPFGTYIGNVLETLEFSPLDPPGSGEHKYYEPGIGFMKSNSLHGTLEFLELTDIE